MRKLQFATMTGLALFFAACQGGDSENAATNTATESENASEKTGQAFIEDEFSKPAASLSISVPCKSSLF